jgi:hypothetical protein
MNKKEDLLLTRQEWITVITPDLVKLIKENIEKQRDFLKKEVMKLQEQLNKIKIKTVVEAEISENLEYKVNNANKLKPVDITFEADWHSLPSHKLMQQPERIQLKVKEIVNKINALIDKYPQTCIRRYNRELNSCYISPKTMLILWKQHIEGQLEIKNNSKETHQKIIDKLYLPALEHILPKL